MKKYSKILNDQTKQVAVGTGTNIESYRSIGMTEMEVEQGYDGCWYIAGYAPQKPQEVKEQEVRDVRNDYLKKYIDDRAKSPFMWNEVSDEEKEVLQAYRKYLMDYPETEGWFEQNPKTLEEWKI
jgi:hypothetical protein